METHVDLKAIAALFDRAEKEGRFHLFEYEVYDLIRSSGSETPPRYLFVQKKDRLEREQVESFPGERIVVKIVSPLILHKSDVGGVQIVEKTMEAVLSTVRRMYYDVPARFADAVRLRKFHPPRDLASLGEEQMQEAVAESVNGVVLCQYMHPDSQEFGNELLVSLRRTREFGMIVSAGLGGTDTELYASRFRKGQAIVAASTEMVDGEEFFSLFRRTISYQKLAGLTRGQKRIVTDEQLLECFSAFIELGNYFSPLSSASHVIDELEINPFAFSNYLMLPLDGLCRFRTNPKTVASRPEDKIDRLLHPRSIAVAGASAKKRNIGRIILENINMMGFDRKRLHVIHPSAAAIDDIDAVPKVSALPGKVDLLILAVKSEVLPEVLEEVISGDLAESVILVPAGIGEELEEAEVLARLRGSLYAAREKGASAPVLLGGNSLGILSVPGGYDGLFIPESKLPRRGKSSAGKTVFISQSGAYMITRMSKLAFLDPAYAVSIGNQIDLTAGDFLHYFRHRNELETLAFYIEGFDDFDGLRFTRAVKEAASAGKEVIFYKAGRTEEGKTALSGHTASIAGDYMVCESCVAQAGAFVAETFTEFEGLLCLSRALHTKTIGGNRLAAVSNAGYEAVGVADNIIGEDYALKMAAFGELTVANLAGCIKEAGLSEMVAVANPVDVTPMATEDVYTSIIEILLADEAVDAIIVAIVPLTPILHTLPDEDIADEFDADGRGIVERMVTLNRGSNKPLVMVIDSGPLYDHIADGLEEAGLPVFRSADQAVRVLGKYIRTRLALSGP